MAVPRITRALSGRRPEQDILSRLAESDRSEFLAIYGRRRVGKTFLVRRFFQDLRVTYFEMVGRFQGSLADQLRIFSESFSETFLDHDGCVVHVGRVAAHPEMMNA